MDELAKSYQVLGLQPGASAEEARQAYRDLVNVWHPDRFGHDERLRLKAQEKLKEINGAYEVVKASLFDQSIAPHSATAVAAGDPTNPSTEPATENLSRGRGHWVILGLVGAALLATGLFIALKRKPDGKPASVATTSEPRLLAPRSALVFNGNGRVEISTTGLLAGTFTLECWAMTTRPKGTETIVSSRGPKDFGFDIKFREGKRFHGDIGDGSQWLAKMANATFRYNRGIWYHIAYVVTPDRYTIYVNGTAIDDGLIYPRGSPMLYDADHRLRIGSDELETADLDGSIAELRIWKVARSAEQIKQNMNVTLSGKESDLQGYWRFDEGTGTEITDCSGHNFGGTLVGNVKWTTNAPPIAR